MSWFFTLDRQLTLDRRTLINRRVRVKKTAVFRVKFIIYNHKLTKFFTHCDDTITRISKYKISRHDHTQELEISDLACAGGNQYDSFIGHLTMHWLRPDFCLH